MAVIVVPMGNRMFYDQIVSNIVHVAELTYLSYVG